MFVHLSTYLARSPARLLERIETLQKQYANQNLVWLFALSAKFPDTRDLGRVVDRLLKVKDTRTVGCLSGRLGSTRLNNMSLENDLKSLSVAVLDSQDAKLFRSTIPGRKEIQVGRWHAFRRNEEDPGEAYALPPEVMSWEKVWEGGKPTQLPEDLRSLAPSTIHNVIYLSDLKPEGLLSSFRNLPNVTKLGLLTTSTPFITGQPVALFYNQEIYGTGAVGLALTGTPGLTSSLDISFPGARKLGVPMTVTQCDGNMVNLFAEGNPTQLLLAAIKNSGLDGHIPGWSKEEEQFSLGALSLDGKLDCLYKITAGDPSRGSLSLDSPSAPAIGTRVQFLHRPPTITPSVSFPSNSQSLNFLTVSDDLDLSPQHGSADDFELVLENKFVASSENGFVFERATRNGENVKCSMSGSLGSLSWPSAL